jgi:hypothetical protein
MLDMRALAAKNEEERAISNVPINARGDIIDNRGNVTVPREDVSAAFYKDNVPAADEAVISIKDDEPAYGKKKKANQPVENPLLELTRTERERTDGTKYFEIEYSDGSMSEEDILDT